MAFDKKPSTWLGAGYATGTNTVIFNTNAAASNKLLAELEDAEAHATTGDIRAVVHALCEALFVAWNAQASADRPTRMTISKSMVGAPNGTDLNVSYQINLTLTPEVEVAAE